MTVTIDGTSGITTPGMTNTGNESVSGTTTLSTGILNIGSGQIYKDASGNVGVGTSSPDGKLTISGGVNTFQRIKNTTNSVWLDLLAGDASSGGLVETSTNHPLRFGTNDTERMRIDSSGNVGIGTSSPGAAAGYTTLDVSNATNGARIRCLVGSTAYGGMYTNGTTDFRIGSLAAVPLNIITGSNTVATFDTSGNLLVGTTSAPTGSARFRAVNGSTNDWSFGPNTGSSFVIWNSSSVGVYISTGNTSWTATSDERLKENLIPIENAVAKVSTLRAVTGNFIADEEKKSRAFLIAQDVQAVLPEAVDASDPDKLGVQYTDTIPLLVAAIKELTARLESLEAK